MNEEELIERIEKLKEHLSEEASEHAHLREIAEDKVLKAYHLGHIEARRVIVDHILDITLEHYRDKLEERKEEVKNGTRRER